MRHLGILIMALALIVGSAGCSKDNIPTNVANGTGTTPASNADIGAGITPARNFRSDSYYLTVELPANWAAAEGPVRVASPFEGLVAFNSWNQRDFWTRAGQDGFGNYYGLQTIAEQVPQGGAYVALVRVWGPAPVLGYDIPEYNSNDLEALWTTHDARHDGGKFIEFYKWGRSLRLEVYCSPNASDTTVAALNALMKSWQFDRIPAGDAEWAETQARQLLPESVGPLWFPMRPGRTSSEDLHRVTEVELRGKTVHFRFIYSWDKVIPPYPIPADYQFKSSRWWEIDVLPTGEAVLTGEGGSSLPK